MAAREMLPIILFSVFLSLATVPIHVSADAVSGYVFTEPVSGSDLSNDLTETFLVGNTINISWIGNTLIASPADLWITHWRSNDISIKLQSEFSCGRLVFSWCQRGQ
jgi:hypothetical protein